MIISALDIRMKRAQKIAAEHGIQFDATLARFIVPSQTGNGEYRVVIETDQETGWLTRAECTCPDYARTKAELEDHFSHTSEAPHPGISHIDGIPVCKHVLAALIEFGYFKAPFLLSDRQGAGATHTTGGALCHSSNLANTGSTSCRTP